MLRTGRDLSLHDLSAPPAYFEALHARLQDLYACQCEHCQSSAQLSAHTLHLSLEKSFKNHLNKGKTALKTLFDNQGYQPKDLQTEKAYQDLVQSTTDIFELAIQDNDLPDDMRRALASDAFLFGSLKTNAQLFEGSKLLTKQDGTLKSFQELTQDFDKLNKRYNENYLESEYEFAVGSAQMASKWSEFGSSERYYLQYRTAKDERVRASHAALADITLPKEDPFWDSFLPPNGWMCRCQTVEVLKSNYEPSNSEDALKKGETATTEIGKSGKNRLEIFRFNPGKNEVLFPPKHPYNKVAGAKEVKERVQKANRYDNIGFEKAKNINNNGVFEKYTSGRQNPVEENKNEKAFRILANNGAKYRMLPVINDGNKNPDGINLETNKFVDIKISESINGKNIIQNAFKDANKQGVEELIIQLTKKPESYKEMYKALKFTIEAERAKTIKNLSVIFPNNTIKNYELQKLKDKIRKG